MAHGAATVYIAAIAAQIVGVNRRRKRRAMQHIGIRPMSAYIISDVTIQDRAAIEVYRESAAASIAQHDGSYIVRGGAIEVLEGQWQPRMIIIAEFPDMERARTWYRSPEYASALDVRDKALSRNLILVEGVAPEA
jgi:uncharacterized protein (DUF1330 family)